MYSSMSCNCRLATSRLSQSSAIGHSCGVQVEGDVAARGRVAKLMRDAAAEMGERPHPLCAANVVLVAREHDGHAIHGLAQRANLIIAIGRARNC